MIHDSVQTSFIPLVYNIILSIYDMWRHVLTVNNIHFPSIMVKNAYNITQPQILYTTRTYRDLHYNSPLTQILFL